MADTLTQLPNKGNQKTTHESNYIRETMSEINHIKEISEGMFPINFKIIFQYQRKYPSLTAKFNTSKYKRASFHGGSYNHFTLITCEDKKIC